MISRIHGTLLRRDIGTIEVLTPGGVAYEIDVPLTVYERLPAAGAAVELRTHQVFREDAAEIFGFLDGGERDLFRRLLSASGVGPKLALAMLSAMAPDRLVRAIADRDIATLRQIPGLGTKKAERLALELGDRIGELAAAVGAGAQPRGRAPAEAVGALVALGYSSSDAAAAVRAALDADAGLAGGALIKAALGVVAAR
jgi:holliday junction DNA helicase RuvA